MKKLIAILIFLLSSLSYGQQSWVKGELHLKDSTVLKGLIKIPQVSSNLIKLSGKEKVKFRPNMEQKISKYDATKVVKVLLKAYKTNPDIYEFVAVSKRKKSLFKLVKRDKVTLYTRTVTYNSSTPIHTGNQHNGTWTRSFNGFHYFDEYYVMREGENMASPIVALRIGPSFKQRALIYFSDCPAIVSKLNDKTFNKEDIIEVVEKYNECNEKIKLNR